MTDPLVSVCTITYGHEAFIRRTIEGVMKQRTDFGVEMVIGNDASPDGTGPIIESCIAQYPGRIVYLNHEANIGMMRNFMSVFKRCRGKYIALLDGDDEWTDPEKLAKQVAVLESNADIAISFHDTLVVSDSDAFEPYCSNGEFRTESSMEDLIRKNFLQTCSVVYRGGIVTEFPDWFADLPAGDWPLHLLHAAHGRIHYLSDCMAKYRVHAGGIWSETGNIEKVKKWIPMCRTLDRHFGHKYTQLFQGYEMECELSIAAYSTPVSPILEHLRRAIRLAKAGESRFPVAACLIRFLRLLAGRMLKRAKSTAHA